MDANTRSYVRAVVARYVRGTADVEDVTQDALLAAHRFRDAFRGAASHRTWLHRIAVTTALGFLRRTQRHRRRDDAYATIAPTTDPGADTRDALIAHEDAARAAAELAQLPTTMRRVFELRATGADGKEIAATLGIGPENVKVSMFRARQRLRTALAENANGPSRGRRITTSRGAAYEPALWNVNG